MLGESGCVFLLGAHQSGKSFSLLGKDGDFAKMGFVGRMASDLIEKATGKIQGKTGPNEGGLVLMMSSFLVQV